MLKRILAAAAALVMALALVLPAAADGYSTDVKFKGTGLEITGITEDFVVPIGGSGTLSVSARGLAPFTFLWEVSADGVNFADAPGDNTLSNYELTGAVENTPKTEPYSYRVTVTDGGGYTDSAEVRVLVANEYSARTISIRGGDVAVTGYMHRDTRLVISAGPGTAALTAALAEGCVALISCDISLVNQDDEVVPYFGSLEITFDVGALYDGSTLRVLHYIGGAVSEYFGEVQAGKLTVIVSALSPFLVEAPANSTYTLNITAGTGGSASPSGTVRVAEGGGKLITFLPDEGYTVSTLTVDGAATEFSGNSYFLDDITANHSVEVSFARVEPTDELHTVTITSGAHGSVSPSGTLQVRHGFAQTVYFYPEAGYELGDVFVNGVAMSVVGNSFTLSAVTQDTVLTASFRYMTSQPPDTYIELAASAGLNGKISPKGTVKVEYDGGMYFYFIPDEGYQVDEVRIDGVVTPVSDNRYHFEHVQGPHSIDVTFVAAPTPPTIYHTVTATVGTGGSISPSGAVQVADGGSQTFTFIPDANYEIAGVSVDGAPVSFTGSSYTLENITDDHTVHVTFSPVTPPVVTHTVTATAGTGGSVSPSGAVKIADGGSQTFTFIPDANYEIAGVSVDGAPVSFTGSSYTLENITADHTVHVTFSPMTPPVVTHTVTATAGTGGSISPAGAVQVADGGSETFTFIPDANYEIAGVSVDGAPVSFTGSSYTLENITADHTVHVTFRIATAPPPQYKFYAIIASAGRGGSISPEGRVRAISGSDVTFTFIPDEGYEVDMVLVDGARTYAEGSKYTFDDLSADHYIHVTFRRSAAPEPEPEPTPGHGGEPTKPEPDAPPAPGETTEYFTIAASSGGHGKVSPDGSIVAEAGGSAYFYFIADEGYEVDTVTVDGASVEPAYSYEFENIGGDHTLHVTFRKKASEPEPTVYRDVTVTAEGGGTISPSGKVQIPEGGSQTFYFIAEDGYEVAAVYVNGVEQAVTGGQFTVNDVSGDVELKVEFRPVSAPVGGDEECRCLWAKLFGHCAICSACGGCATPWCVLLPILAIFALAFACWYFILRRRGQK